LTLGVALLLPAAGLIYTNFRQLEKFERDKVLEAAIHRDFQELLGITEKRMNKKIYGMVDDFRGMYPSPDADQLEKEVKLEQILQKTQDISDVFYFDEKGLIVHSQRHKMDDKYYREQHESFGKNYAVWFKSEGHTMLEAMRKRNRPLVYPGPAKRQYGDAFVVTVVFDLPKIQKDRVVFAGFTLDDLYLKKCFFPSALKEAISDKMS